MKIGKLRTFVHFQRRSTAQDSSTGANTPNWTTYESVFADVRPIRGRESLEGTNKLNAMVTHRIYVRAHMGFTPQPEDRILQDTKVIEITSVANVDERDFYYEILGFEDYNK